MWYVVFVGNERNYVFLNNPNSPKITLDNCTLTQLMKIAWYLRSGTAKPNCINVLKTLAVHRDYKKTEVCERVCVCVYRILHVNEAVVAIFGSAVL